MTPKFSGIDHVHLYVSDRELSAQWYARVLGFAVVERLRFWAEPASGPLTLEDESGTVHLALFQRDRPSPSSALAFGADGESFLKWKTHLESHGLAVTCSDHQVAWSLYFNDPEDHLHEITSYDHQFIAEGLRVIEN